jgi:hypothetical protein
MANVESCFGCVYSHWDRNQALWTMSVGVAVRPVCGNQPDFPGRMRECPLGRVCRNFRPRPPAPTGETVKTIPLGDGFYAYVDAADYEWLNQWTWHLYNGYAVRRENNRVISMHRQIMQAPKGMEVDHKNRNKVDNTRENLHICTHAQNARNRRKPRTTSSRFWGVSHMKSRGKYRAFVCHKGEVVSRGCFTDEIEAARAHDRGVIELSGESAQLNFPEEWPARRRAQVHARFQAGLKRDGKKAGSKEGKTGGRPRPRRRGHKPGAASAKPRATSNKGRGRAQ